jgi:hypothetical protein
MFRTDLLSIIRSLNAVFTTIGICQTSYFDCLLADVVLSYKNTERDAVCLGFIQDDWIYVNNNKNLLARK